MSLPDGTEIVRSEMREDGSVKVYFEMPVMLGFRSVECWLPKYEWKNNHGFSEKVLAEFDEFVHSLADVMIDRSRKKSFESLLEDQ